MDKKRILKLAGIILLLLAIIILAVLNVMRKRQETDPELVAVTPTPEVNRPYIPARPQSWMPKEGEILDETKIPKDTILIKDFAYYPRNLRVTAGTTVRVINGDATAHSVSSDAKLFDTGVLEINESGSLTFATPGTYPYHCRRHTAMQGSIIVTP